MEHFSLLNTRWQRCTTEQSYLGWNVRTLDTTKENIWQERVKLQQWKWFRDDVSSCSGCERSSLTDTERHLVTVPIRLRVTETKWARGSITCRFHCSIFAASLSVTRESRKVTFHFSAIWNQRRQKHIQQRERSQNSCQRYLNTETYS